jgi:signal peptidase I
MFPNIPAGSRLISKWHPYKSITDVKRGDVVIFSKAVTGQVYKYIWRVVALPGDKIELSDDSVAINGRTLKHEQVRKEGDFLIVREWNGEASYDIAFDQKVSNADRPRPALTVPGNYAFVLGDNRYNAEDSIYIGPIPFESIVEKKIF